MRKHKYKKYGKRMKARKSYIGFFVVDGIMTLTKKVYVKNVLIIDNEPFILDIFSQFLSDNGFDSQSALSNDDALCYLRSFILI